jgi:hypothetical protein
MGYAVDAEYTIELISEPRAYEYIAQRYFCTGFLLASRLNESALQTILHGWQQIDEVTSNRIRFLFFIENETTLIGYPNYPRFTESGFKRGNPKLYHEANAAQFTIIVQPGRQVPTEARHNRQQASWHPEQRVRRLAQELGVVSILPCLIWVRHDRQEMYVKQITDLAPTDILAKIGRFCEKFYDENVLIISKISAIEGEMESVCGGLYFTAEQLPLIFDLRDEYSRIKRLVEKLSDAPAPGKDISYYLEEYSRIAKEASSIATSWPDKGMNEHIGPSIGWAYHSQKQLLGVFGGGVPNVPQAADLIDRCRHLVHAAPGEIPKMRPFPTPPSNEPLRQFFSWLSERRGERFVADEDTFEAAVRWLTYNERELLPAKSRQQSDVFLKNYIITLLTTQKLMSELENHGASPPAIAVEGLNSHICQIVDTCVYATVTTLRFCIYFNMRQRLNVIAHTLGRLKHEGEDSLHLADASPENVTSLIKEIDFESTKLKWTALADFEHRPLPPQLLKTSFLGSERRNASDVVQELKAKIAERLRPIGDVMDELSATSLPPVADELALLAEKAKNFIVVSSGGKINLADTMEVTDMSKTSTFGNNAKIDGDFTQADVAGDKTQTQNVGTAGIVSGRDSNTSGSTIDVVSAPTNVNQGFEQVIKPLVDALNLAQCSSSQTALMTSYINMLRDQAQKPTQSRNRDDIKLAFTGLKAAAELITGISPVWTIVAGAVKSWFSDDLGTETVDV